MKLNINNFLLRLAKNEYVKEKLAFKNHSPNCFSIDTRNKFPSFERWLREGGLLEESDA